MFLTFLTFLFILCNLFFFGTPILLLSNTIKKNKKYYLFAPFIGIATIIFILQNLVFFNIPLKYTTYPFWVLGFILWGLVFYFKKFIWPTKKIISVFFIGLLATLISGWGQFYLGHKECYGECWIDQHNYTATSHYLIHEPFKLDIKKINFEPYKYLTISRLEQRIGQYVLQGFFANSLQSDPLYFFGHTMLLSSFLLAISLYLITRKFFKHKKALLISLLASITPIFIKLQLENFLSNALAIPFLILSIYLIVEIFQKRSIRDLLICIGIIGTIISIYYEIYLLIIGILAIAIIFSIINYKKYFSPSKKLVFLILALPVGVYLFSPIATKIALQAHYITKENILPHIYPFAFTREMIPNLLWGDMIFNNLKQIFINNETALKYSYLITNILAFFIFFISIYGWGVLSTKGKKNNLLFLVLSAVISVPLIVYAQFKNFPYQFFKLLICVFPLFIIGFYPGIYRLIKIFNLKIKFAVISSFFLLFLFILANFSLIQQTVIKDPNHRIFITSATQENLFLIEKFKKTRETLMPLKNQNIVLESKNHIVNAWMTYFAKNNKIWLINPNYGGITSFNRNFPETQSDNLNFMPESALFYSYEENILKTITRDEAINLRDLRGYKNNY